jgi:acetyltransferase-like isoleucine patch superfamily enzyme
VSVGTNATILPVTICDHVVIGAGAVVTRDISEPGIYAGNPARLIRRLPGAGRAAAPGTDLVTEKKTELEPLNL